MDNNKLKLLDQGLNQSVCSTIQPPGNGTWVSSGFILNKALPNRMTAEYDAGYPDYLTNNTPPTLVYVRVAPNQLNPSKKVFYLNGYQQPNLYLTKGRKYQFNIMTCGFPFEFVDKKGKNISGVPAVDYDLRTYTMTDNLPQQFYYTNPYDKEMRGNVYLI